MKTRLLMLEKKVGPLGEQATAFVASINLTQIESSFLAVTALKDWKTLAHSVYIDSI